MKTIFKVDPTRKKIFRKRSICSSIWLVEQRSRKSYELGVMNADTYIHEGAELWSTDLKLNKCKRTF